MRNKGARERGERREVEGEGEKGTIDKQETPDGKEEAWVLGYRRAGAAVARRRPRRWRARYTGCLPVGIPIISQFDYINYPRAGRCGLDLL